MVKVKKKSKKPARKIASHSGEEKLNGSAPKGGSRNAKAAGPERIEKSRHKEKLPCAIPPEIVVIKADEFARVFRSREALKEERRSAMAGFKSRFAHIDEQLGELAAAVEQHTVSRDVECIDYLVASSIITVRQDTLETVTERPATADELQEKIFGKIDKANAEAAARVGTREAGEDSKLLPALFDEEIAAADAALEDDNEPLDWSVDPKNPDVRKMTAAELDAQRAKLRAAKAERADA